MFPCQDGWMGCMVGTERVGPELRRDDAQRAIPSDARIGWFDLQATPSFSPFVGLSDYSAVAVADAGEAPTPAPTDVELAGTPDDPDDAVAVVEEPPRPAPVPSASGLAAEQAAVDADAARAARASAVREQAEATARSREAAALAKKQKADADAARAAAALAIKKAAAVNAEATAAERAKLDGEASLAQNKADSLEKERKASEANAATHRQAELAAEQKAASELAAQKKAEDARIAAETKDREEKARLAKLKEAELAAQQQKSADAKRIADEKTAAAAAKAAAAAPVPAPAEVAKVAPAAGTPLPTVADGECADTSKLEPVSLLGKLGEGTMQCLETRLVNAPKMTDKKKISGLLMTDAWAKGDKERWETLIKRHLDEIDQSDPDLCYKYALHLSRQGPGRASGVIRWANVALENRTVWIGDTYTSRVYSLYKVRAAASQSLWQQAEADHVATPSDESREKVEKYRNMTKVNAREWFEYAKSSGKDPSTALQLCKSAAGTSDYCEAN